MLACSTIPLLFSSARPCVDDDLYGNDEERNGSHKRIEELFLTDLIYPQERGELQVSTGLWLEHDGGERGAALPLLIELGLTDRLQVELLLPYEYDSSDAASGLGNVGIGALYPLAREEDRDPRFAIGSEFTFPSAAAGMGDEGWSIEPFVLGYRRGERFDINTGLGLELENDDGENTLSAHGAIAFIAELGMCVGTFELLGEIDDEAFELSAAPGAVWRFGDYQLGCALAMGLTDAAPDVQLLITLPREWSLIGPR